MLATGQPGQIQPYVTNLLFAEANSEISRKPESVTSSRVNRRICH